MNNKFTISERTHIANVKALPCSVCNAPPPSDAHHVRQDCHWTVVALCKSCHQDNILGIHGQKRMWHIMKLDELQTLNITIKRLFASRTS